MREIKTVQHRMVHQPFGKEEIEEIMANLPADCMESEFVMFPIQNGMIRGNSEEAYNHVTELAKRLVRNDFSAYESEEFKKRYGILNPASPYEWAKQANLALLDVSIHTFHVGHWPQALTRLNTARYFADVCAALLRRSVKKS